MREIVFLFDKTYLELATVAIGSVFLSNPNVDGVHCVLDMPAGVDISPLRRVGRTFRRDIHVHYAREDRIRGFRGVLHISRATYAKLLFPEILPFETILYLDADVIVRCDLGDLLSLDVSQHPIFGVGDATHADDGRARLGLAASEPYLNAGVLVANLDAWRADDMVNRFFEIYETRQSVIQWCEQDVFNIAFVGRKGLIPEKYNVQRGRFGAHQSDHDIDRELGPPEDFDGIFHFSSTVKPWCAWTTEWERRLFSAYRTAVGATIPEVKQAKGLAEAYWLSLELRRQGRVNQALHAAHIVLEQLAKSE